MSAGQDSRVVFIDSLGGGAALQSPDGELLIALDYRPPADPPELIIGPEQQQSRAHSDANPQRPA